MIQAAVLETSKHANEPDILQKRNTRNSKWCVPCGIYVDKKLIVQQLDQISEMCKISNMFGFKSARNVLTVVNVWQKGGRISTSFST